jgi:hypothetical protein
MNTLSRRSLLLAGGSTAALLAAGSASPASASRPRPDPNTSLIGWNRTLLRIVRTRGAQPATVHATRSFAMMHAAVHDAVAVATWHASGVAAAAQAAHDVLVALFPAMTADLDAQLVADLATVPDSRARAAGEALGRYVARSTLAGRANDGSTATPPLLTPGTAPGQYRPTPPGFGAAVFTHWPAVTPFVLRYADRFRPPPYPLLSSEAYARATNEVKAFGQDVSASRSADQSVQATFWAAPIWNYWNEITQTLTHDADLFTTARAFALLNLTFADAVIAFYDAKYHYRIWRPITAIRLADTDGNPDTSADAAWTPLATTPADPAYPGAHSVIAQAGAVVLRRVLGRVRPFTVTSEASPGVVRTFDDPQNAADEAGLSRIFAGVHTRLDHIAGQRLGRQVAQLVLAHAHAA